MCGEEKKPEPIRRWADCRLVGDFRLTTTRKALFPTPNHWMSSDPDDGRSIIMRNDPWPLIILWDPPRCAREDLRTLLLLFESSNIIYWFSSLTNKDT